MLYQLSYVRTSAGPTRSYLRRASTLGANPDGVQCPRSRAAGSRCAEGACRPVGRGFGARGARTALALRPRASRARRARAVGSAVRPCDRIGGAMGPGCRRGRRVGSSGPTPLRPTGTQVTSGSGASTRREHVSFFKSDRESGHHLRAIGAAVARFLHTEEVTGSIPVSPTAGSSDRCPADVAQLVEHHLAKVRVAGSNPVVRSGGTALPTSRRERCSV